MQDHRALQYITAHNRDKIAHFFTLTYKTIMLTGYKQRFFAFMISSLTFLLSAGLTAQIFSGSDSEEPKTNTELSKKLFPGDVEYRPVSANGKNYLFLRCKTRLPSMTRVKLELYYVRGQPPIDYLTHRKTVRVQDNGHIETRVLGLKRPLWAGKYKLVLTLKPSDQIPEVKKKLKQVDHALRRTRSWFFGTKEKLKKQRKQALDTARRDLKTTLNLAEELKTKFSTFIQRRKQIDQSFPAPSYLNLARKWLNWSLRWTRRYQNVKKSNERRPRFNDRTISFFFAEDRTAYFLKYDLQKLNELYQMAREELWSTEQSPKSARVFRKKYRNLRQSVSDTMVFLNLVVPMEKEDRKALRRQLNKMDNTFSEIHSYLSNSAGKDLPTDKIQQNLNKVLGGLLQLNDDLPDLIYRRFLQLTQKLNSFSSDLSTMNRSEALKRFEVTRKKFENLRKLTQSFLEAMK